MSIDSRRQIHVKGPPESQSRAPGAPGAQTRQHARQTQEYVQPDRAEFDRAQSEHGQPDREQSDHSPSDEHVGALVSQAVRQLGQLARDEFRLAQAEMAANRRHLGFGGGLFGGAGLMAFIGVQAIAACVIAALAEAMPVWLAALIVGVAAVVTAAVMALLGKKQVQRLGSAFEESVDSVKADVAALKEAGHR
ncbi:MAG: phage holin family protein [Catenulispora sp.]|nr:phage holin family protein [Catenulispora sp.]